MLDILVSKNSIGGQTIPCVLSPILMQNISFVFSDMDDCALLFRYENDICIAKILISE